MGDRLDLPQGLDEGKLWDAVRASGYPLQTVVARELSKDFDVDEEWGYVDRHSAEQRALDIFARRPLETKSSRLEPQLVLLIECKRSDMPHVFFQAAIPRTLTRFPTVMALPHSDFQLHDSPNRYREVTASEFLAARELEFVGAPPLAVAFSRAERKGSDLSLSGSVPYNHVVMPLASAHDHLCAAWGDARSDQETYYPSLIVCICVLDAPMILAAGTPEAPELSNRSWIRLLHKETKKDGNWWGARHYHVDVVNRHELRPYIDDQLVPFAEQMASRIIERQSMVLAAKGMVQDFDTWSWADLKPVS